MTIYQFVSDSRYSVMSVPTVTVAILHLQIVNSVKLFRIFWGLGFWDNQNHKCTDFQARCNLGQNATGMDIGHAKTPVIAMDLKEGN